MPTARARTRFPRFALAAWAALAAAARADEKPAPVTAIEHVTVIDVRAGAARPGQTVVVRGRMIAAVGPVAEVPVPAGAARIDGRGKYLIPGLWDMHAHLADDRMRGLFLAAGVTGVRHMMSPNPLYPAARLAKVADGGPRVVGVDWVLDGPDTLFPKALQWIDTVKVVRTAAEARAKVREAAENREPFVKVHAGIGREAFLAAAAEAKACKIPLVGHVPNAVEAEQAVRAGMASIEHLTGVAVACAASRKPLREELRAALTAGRVGKAGDVTGWKLQVRAHADFDPEAARGLFHDCRAAGTWHCPTLVQTRAWADLADPAVRHDPRVALVPRPVRMFWAVEPTADGLRLPHLEVVLTRDDLWLRRQLLAYELRLVGEMHRAGVGLLAGTDTPNPYVLPGFALHDELALFAQAGLTPAEALRTATLNPAKFFGRGDLGEVKAGCRADLVLLEADPLADVRNTRWVHTTVSDGRVHPRADLLRLMDERPQVAGGRP